jgi:hypothetical protein
MTIVFDNRQSAMSPASSTLSQAPLPAMSASSAAFQQYQYSLYDGHEQVWPQAEAELNAFVSTYVLHDPEGVLFHQRVQSGMDQEMLSIEDMEDKYLNLCFDDKEGVAHGHNDIYPALDVTDHTSDKPVADLPRYQYSIQDQSEAGIGFVDLVSAHRVTGGASGSAIVDIPCRGRPTEEWLKAGGGHDDLVGAPRIAGGSNSTVADVPSPRLLDQDHQLKAGNRHDDLVGGQASTDWPFMVKDRRQASLLRTSDSTRLHSPLEEEYLSSLDSPSSELLVTPASVSGLKLPPVAFDTSPQIEWGIPDQFESMDLLAKQEVDKSSEAFAAVSPVASTSDLRSSATSSSAVATIPLPGSAGRVVDSQAPKVYTGFRHSVIGKTVPLDAPIKKRRYLGPSKTARKEVTKAFEKQRAESEAFGGDGESRVGKKAKVGKRGKASKPSAKRKAESIDPSEDEEEYAVTKPTSEMTEEELIEEKRRKNTIAARKSRLKKTKTLQDLVDAVMERDEGLAFWQARCAQLEQTMQRNGMAPPRRPTPPVMRH